MLATAKYLVILGAMLFGIVGRSLPDALAIFQSDNLTITKSVTSVSFQQGDGQHAVCHDLFSSEKIGEFIDEELSEEKLSEEENRPEKRKVLKQLLKLIGTPAILATPAHSVFHSSSTGKWVAIEQRSLSKCLYLQFQVFRI